MQPKVDKKWQAECDARTLMSATEINTDRSRRSAALKEVKNIAKEAEKTAKTAKKLSGRGSSKSSGRGRKR